MGDAWVCTPTQPASWDMAYACARGSHLAYELPDVIAAQAGHWGCQSWHAAAQGTECIILRSAQTVPVLRRYALLAFRGTDASLVDAYTDVDCVWTEAPLAGACHRGFLVALDAIWDKLRPELGRVYDSGLPLFLTGHSLGGALATLCAARLYDAGLPVWGCHTFGSPRVGDAVFARAINAEQTRPYRHVNNNDTITRLPPRVMGYRHTGALVYYDEDGHPYRDPSRWFRFCDRVHGRLADFGEWGTDGLKDHGCAEYVRTVGRARLFEPGAHPPAGFFLGK